jgi:hypothetical protein
MLETVLRRLEELGQARTLEKRKFCGGPQMPTGEGGSPRQNKKFEGVFRPGCGAGAEMPATEDLCREGRGSPVQVRLQEYRRAQRGRLIA